MTMFLESGFQIAPYFKNGNDVTIYRHDVIENFFDVVLFCMYILVTSSRFTSISSLILEL